MYAGYYGEGLTSILTESESVQPLAAVTVTKYFIDFSGVAIVPPPLIFER
jgi:hypothetical protein